MPRTLRAPCDRRFRLSRPRLGTVFHRWLRLPAILEQRLAHQAECRCSGARRSPRPLARGKPALLALEDREAPQLFVPMAAAVGGAIVASQVLASPANVLLPETSATFDAELSK